MDFHAAMETFAEAWVAANTQTAVNSADPQVSPLNTNKKKHFFLTFTSCWYFFKDFYSTKNVSITNLKTLGRL